MRTVVVLVFVAALGWLFIAQKQHEQKTRIAAAATATPRPISEHEWAKHSIDTTHKVIRQIAQQRKEDTAR